MGKYKTRIRWEPWTKKFAFLPKKTKNGIVWFKSYYERQGYNLYCSYLDRGTLFDMIKGDGG